MKGLLSLALTTLSAGLAMMAGYLLVLTAAALVGRPRSPRPTTNQRRFAVLVPAHNEEALIGRLLQNLRQLDYPRQEFDVYVVADNCDDETASIARAHDALVYERSDPTLRAKGYALKWLLERIRMAERGRAYDAFVVLDADSVVDTHLLHWMNRYLESGSVVLQAYYTVLNAGDSPVTMLRYAALAALHYVRPLGRAILGLSCGLKGNGMCFAAAVLERFDWTWFTLAEDVEFHLALVQAGIRVDFVPQVTVRADMPISLAEATSQNARWERGRLQLLSGPVAALIRDGILRRSALRLDAAVEQLIPPLSVPLALASMCVVGSLLCGARQAALLAGGTVAGLIFHLLAGLVLVRAPAAAYAALAHAPAYIGWKFALYARTLVSRGGTAWVRTARPPGASSDAQPG